MPGRFEPLKEFLRKCQAESVDEIVCLAALEEIAKKSAGYRAAIEAGRIPVPIEHFPIPDYGVPEDTDALVNLTCQMAEKLTAGRKIVLHCAAGHGRTGMVAVMVLLAAGMLPESALAAVEAAGSSPETGEQRALLKIVASRLAAKSQPPKTRSSHRLGN